MQPIATTVMDLHLDLVMTYTLQTLAVVIATGAITAITVITHTTAIAVVPLTEAATVTTTSSQEAAISIPITSRCIMKPFPHKKDFFGWVGWLFNVN